MQTYSLKFVLVGDSGVGKSQLLRRFAKKDFSHDSQSTLNMEFSTRDIPFERCNIKAQIWDTVGQERFESLTKAYYRDAVGALLVYDITNRQSFENLKSVWLKQLREYAHERLHIVLVGNKLDSDDPSKRQVEVSEAIAFARDNRMDFTESSALSNSKVESAFRRMILSVAPVIPDINSHLGLSDLPEGWIHLSHTQAQPEIAAAKAEQNSSGAEDPLINASPSEEWTMGTMKISEDDDYFMNYWTGDVTSKRPTVAAQPGVLHTVDLRSSVASTSFYARGTLNVGGTGEDYDELRLAGEDDVELDIKTGKCHCMIL